MSTDTIQTLPGTGTWQIDAAHSSVSFSARHLGLSKVRGSFDEFEGSITIGDEPEGSRIEVQIATGSIRTGQAQRDEHLRSPDFLDVAGAPDMTFRSTRVERKGSDWLLEGDLTIRGTTNPVTLDVEYLGVADDPMSGGQRMAFEAVTSIDRRDFGLTWSAPLETGQILVGNKVDIALEIAATSAAMESPDEVREDAAS